MRLLIAYGREFTRLCPYRLEDLARAAGMSISGIRTAYDEDEIAEVAKLTGTRPRRGPLEPVYQAYCVGCGAAYPGPSGAQPRASAA